MSSPAATSTETPLAIAEPTGPPAFAQLFAVRLQPAGTFSVNVWVPSWAAVSV